MKFNLEPLISQSKRRGSLLFPVFLGLLLLLLTCLPAAAQGTVQAEYVGSKACADCHDELATQFTFGEHARLAEFELYGQHPGCESCHGPGSRHVESMDPADVFSFGDASVRQTEQTCLNCHSDRVGFNWRHSEHSLSGITCDSCHQIHQSRPSMPAAPGFIERPDRLSPIGKMTPPRKASYLKALTYDDFDDVEPYLADTSGKRFGLLFRANWLF